MIRYKKNGRNAVSKTDYVTGLTMSDFTKEVVGNESKN